MKARLPYIIGSVLLVAVEVCIGVFYFSHFIRSYVGDIIIVWVLYCLFRSFVPRKFSSYGVALGILAFSFAVEFLQKAHIADILGVENELLRIIIGTSYAAEDLWCYTAGTAVTILEIFICGRLSDSRNS
ncbi:MAG: DUF2809 domain-containing protein [Ruminococcus sp.]|uniref:ribosomal maturation YjgA family protein n=1 Tax=Ruminococcus sp. TaxID=41978 RepID=UPI0025D1C99D|nr:DUF2809 domain-containing protein [Ruminococcus sp.]MBR5682942.1 DUF2809 domain-containing protein [Ruminococcus sp.]